MKTSARPSSSSSFGPEEQNVADVLDAYLAEIEAGGAASPEQLFAAHPAIAPRLRACLESLQMLGRFQPHAGAQLLVIGAAAGAMLGDFRLVREIGRGGMGVVYEAEQMSLARRVAVKMLPLAMTIDQRALQRFRTEAMAAAQLDHPHIVQVYGVGCERGIHFYAMQYIEGRNLAEMIGQMRGASDTATHRATTPPLGSQATDERSAGRSPPEHQVDTLLDKAYCRRIAALGIQAADALFHAHAQGVIHRDIKPSNLLIDAQGRLAIADFGVARIQDEPGLTIASDVVGTLRYMSPEQALGRHQQVGGQSDVYSLGVTLYELLTLSCPRSAQSRGELMLEITQTDPQPPRRLNPAIPHDLETIVLKAMAREPGERYASAAALRNDLQRFLDDRMIQARRASVAERAGRWCRRHRAMLFAVLGTAVAMSAASGWLIRAAHDRAERLEEIANEQTRQLSERALTDAVQAADKSLDEGRPSEAATVLDRYRRRTASPPVTDFAWNDLERLAESEQIGQGAQHRRADCVAVSPDGRLAASGGTENNVVLWDLKTMRAIATLSGHGSSVDLLAFSPVGNLQCSSESDELIVWDLDRRAELRRISTPHHRVYSLQFAADGQRVCAGGVTAGYGPWRCWNVATGEVCSAARGRDCFRGAMAPDEKTLAISGTLSVSASLFQNVALVAAVAQPDGKIVLAGFEVESSTGRNVCVLRLHTDGTPDWNFGDCGRAVFDLSSGADYASAVALDERGRIILAGVLGGENDAASALVMRLEADGSLDRSFGEEGIARIPHTQATDVAIQPDGRIIIGGTSWDGVTHDFLVARYDARGKLDASFGAGGKIVTAFGAGDELVSAMVLQHDGKLVVGGQNLESQRLSLARYLPDGSLDPMFGIDGKVVAQIGPARSNVNCLAVDGLGRILAGGLVRHGEQCQFALARFLPDGQFDNGLNGEGFVLTPVGKTGEATSISVDGRGRIRLAGLASTGSVRQFAAVRYHADGRLDRSFAEQGILTSDVGQDGAIGYWMLPHEGSSFLIGGAARRGSTCDLAIIRCDADGRVDKAFQPRENYVDIERGEIALLDQRFQPRRRLRGHNGVVAELAWSADGRVVASAGLDHPAVKLWQADSGLLAASIPVLSNAITFSPDRRLLAIAHRGQGEEPYSTVELYDAESGRLQAALGRLEQQIRDIEFSPDGRTLVLAVADGTVRFWQMDNHH